MLYATTLLMDRCFGFCALRATCRRISRSAVHRSRPTRRALAQTQPLQTALAGFLETKSGYDFLQGVGVNYNAPASSDPLAGGCWPKRASKRFASKSASARSSGTEKLANQDRLEKLLALCKRYGIRPTLLLNAHQGVPCPAKFFKKKLAVDAPRGSRAITLADTRDLVVGRSGLNGLDRLLGGRGSHHGGRCQHRPLPVEQSAAQRPQGGRRGAGHLGLPAAVPRRHARV